MNFQQKILKLFLGWSFTCLFLVSSFSVYGQGATTCDALTIIGKITEDANNDIFQGILINGEDAPIKVIRIYNNKWQSVDECIGDCPFPYKYAAEAGDYFVHTQLYDKSWGQICQTKEIKVSVPENGDACSTFCQQDLIEFNSQADVDAFCGCEVITGDVRITGNITSLQPLNGLKRIEGFLAVSQTQLCDFRGLEGLEFIGEDLFIGENPLLKNLKGLENLATIVGGLNVESNPILENLEGLNLTTINGLNIFDNDALVNIDVFRNITSLDFLSIIGNEKLPNLEGLNNLTNLGGVVIAGNEALTTLSALSNLKNVDGNIVIQGNDLLSECCAIADLIDDDPKNGQANGAITITDNLSGCNSIEDILEACQSSQPDCDNISIVGEDGKITISNLTAPIEIVKIYTDKWKLVFECKADCPETLSYPTSAGNYIVEVSFFTDEWQRICRAEIISITVPENNDACSTFCQQDLIEFNSQADVDAFCGCEVITGDVIITGDITSLQPLNGLKRIEGFLAVSQTELSNFNGLEGLEFIGEDLSIAENPLLKNMRGLENLTTINGALNVDQNPVLESFEGLNLTSLNSLNITNNETLVNIDVFRNITSLGSISIIGNEKLPNLEGLNNLTSVSSLVIVGNAITTLSPLANLNNVDGIFVIQDNDLLSECCAIADLIDDDPKNGQANGAITITGNLSGCNSIEDILEACQDKSYSPTGTSRSKGSNFFDVERDISIFPNPAQNQLTIKTNSLQGSKGTIQIYNAFGQEMMVSSTIFFDQPSTTINVSAYENGLYYLQIQTADKRMISKKFLVE